MKKVLVTGAHGFLGAHLSRFLSSKKYKVIPAVRKKNPADKNSIGLDITDRSAVLKAIRSVRPDAIYHLAAQSIPRVSWAEREKTFGINVGGALNLLDGVRLHAPDCRFIFLSSAQVYGRHFQESRPLSETSPIWPENPYAFSKAVAELACFDFAGKYGIDAFVVRALNIVGAGERSDLAFSEWCAQIVRAEAKKKEGEVVTGDLSLKRDFLHVDDAVKALELLLRRGKKGEIYNLGSGKARPLSDYVKFLIQKAKVKITSRQGFSRQIDPRTVSVDVKKMRVLGWKPVKDAFIALEELLREYRAGF